MPKFEKLYTDMVDRLDEISGFEPGVCFCGEVGYHLECQERLRPAIDGEKYAQAYFEGLGYYPVDVTDQDFKVAEQTLIASLGFDPFEKGYKSSDVLENNDTYYFPIGWVGCCGHIVAKESSRVISFGSYVGHIEHIWAYYEGVQFAHSGKDRKNRLIINAVNNSESTVETLKTFLDTSYVDNHVKTKLGLVPIVIEDIDLYFGIRDLFKARMNKWFDFEIQ